VSCGCDVMWNVGQRNVTREVMVCCIVCDGLAFCWCLLCAGVRGTELN